MNMPASRRAVTGAMTDGLGLPQPARISIANNTFTLVDRAGNEMQCNLVDPSVGRYLDVVIVGANANKSKVYYEGEWSPQSSDPPVCWSDNGVAPSAQAISPQSDTCGTCEWNKIGSDVSKRTGNNIKACQDRKKLACYVVGLPLPLGNELFQFQVTPGALKGLAAYGKFVSTHPSASGQGAADVSEVVTRLYFAQGQVGVIGFGAVAPIDAQMDARIGQAYAANLVDEVTGANDVPIQGRLAAPAQQQRLAAPAQQQFAQQPAALPPPQAQQWGPPAAPTGMPAQPAQQFAAAKPVNAAPTPPPPPQPVWDAAAGAWVLPTQAAPTSPYPAPPADDAYAVPGFLQRGQQAANNVSTGPDASQYPAPAQPMSSAPPANDFQPAPQKPATGKGSRGGPRAGAGRPPKDAAPVVGPGFVPAAQQPAGRMPEQPGQAFGAAPPPAQAQYGMAPAGAPPDDMTQALNRAFSTPIPGR